jgi:hypothetical protein
MRGFFRGGGGEGAKKGFTFLEIILRMRSVLCIVMGCDVTCRTTGNVNA